MKKYLYILLVVCVAGILFTCKMGPDFKPPVVPIPEKYTAQSPLADSTANLKWWDIFNDTTLNRIVRTALINNNNVAQAFSRVEQARLVLGATRSDFYPSLGFELDAQYGTEIQGLIQTGKPVQYYRFMPSLSWELDIFGRIRRSTESAKNALFASRYAASAILISLVADVADTYFTLLSARECLEIARRTYQSRQDSYNLINSRFEYGIVSGIDVEQAKIQLTQAAAAIPRYERATVVAYNSLCVLLGMNPESELGITSGLTSIGSPMDIPVGIPANILTRRPDVMEAYYKVASQNAMIGVAQAMRLPNVSITANGGLARESLTNLFSGSSFLWSVAGAITGPIFNFGKNKRQVDIEREKTKQALLGYQQTVIEAFSDVENAMTQINTFKIQTSQFGQTVNAARNARTLSYELYKSGAGNYLNVLYADTSLFEAQISYIHTLQSCLSSYIFLYKSLGGGWILP